MNKVIKIKLFSQPEERNCSVWWCGNRYFCPLPDSTRENSTPEFIQLFRICCSQGIITFYNIHKGSQFMWSLGLPGCVPEMWLSHVWLANTLATGEMMMIVLKQRFNFFSGCIQDASEHPMLKQQSDCYEWGAFDARFWYLILFSIDAVHTS